MFNLLKNPSYLKLWCAQVVSELGDGITHIVVIFLVGQLSDSPLVFSFVLMARYIPNLLFGVFVGPVIDRMSKKVTLVASDLYRLVILLCMIPAHDSLVGLLVLIFLQGIGTVFFEPAKTATIPKIIDKEKIPEAVGLSQSTYMAMNIIAPSIGGALLLFNHVSIIFIIDALTFLVSALLIATLSIKRDGSESDQPESTYVESLKEGVTLVKDEPFLKGIVWLLIVAAFVMSLVGANALHIVLNVFDIGEFHFGLLESVEGMFSVAGALLVPFVMKKVKKNRMIIVTLGVTGVVCITIWPAFFIHQSFPLAPLYVWMSLVGLSNTFLNVPLNSLYMQSVSEEVLGRVSGIINSILHASFLGGLIVGGWVGTVWGGIPTVVGAGVLLVVVSIVFPMTRHYKALGEEHTGEELASA